MRSNEKVFGLIFDQVFEQLLGFASLESVLKICDEEVCDICEKHTWYEGVGLLSALPFARWFGTSVGKTKQKCDKVKQITRYLSKNKTRVCERV